MTKFLVLVNLIVVLTMVLSACGSLTVEVQPPGDSGGEGAGEMSTTLLYGILILAGAAVLIALLSLFRR